MKYLLSALLFTAIIGQFLSMSINISAQDWPDVFANLGGGCAFAVLFGLMTMVKSDA